MKQDILDFLKNLSVVQEKTLAVLQEKQALLVHPDKNALATLAAKESEVLEVLQNVLRRREELLARAAEQGLPSDSIEVLCDKLFANRIEVRRILDLTKRRIQEIRFLAGTNWTMTQKSLVHISQILELIATGGQGKNTYNAPNAPNGGKSTGGGFVDRVA